MRSVDPHLILILSFPLFYLKRLLFSIFLNEVEIKEEKSTQQKTLYPYPAQAQSTHNILYFIFFNKLANEFSS